MRVGVESEIIVDADMCESLTMPRKCLHIERLNE